MPSRPHDAKGLLVSAIRDPDPVIFFEPKRVYRSFKEEVPEDEYTIEIGKANVLNEGDDVTVITWGAMVFQCLEALDQVPEDVSVELIDLRTIWPIDVDTIGESVQKTGRAVVVHEAPKTAGLGAEISSLIQEKCFLHLEAPVQRVTGFDRFDAVLQAREQLLARRQTHHAEHSRMPGVLTNDPSQRDETHDARQAKR